MGYKEGGSTSCWEKGGGHCTQVVWQNSDKVGCGYVDCRDEEEMWMLTCNYLPTGNFNGKDKCIPGEPCSNCPDSHPFCNDGLCAKAEAEPEEEIEIDPCHDVVCDQSP